MTILHPVNCAADLKVSSDEVTAVAITADGKRAVSASSDQTRKVGDLASGQELCTLLGHAGAVTAVAIKPDGQRAIQLARTTR